jgi:hypothetical protein
MVSFKNSLVLLIILSALIEEFSEFPVDEETLLPEQPLKTKSTGTRYNFIYLSFFTSKVVGSTTNSPVVAVGLLQTFSYLTCVLVGSKAFQWQIHQ